MVTRRETLKAALASTLVLPAAACARSLSAGEPEPAKTPAPAAKPPLFEISLAQWSLHRTLFKGDLDHLDFPAVSAKDYGISAVEYVNAFFKEKNSASYVSTLKRRCDDAGAMSESRIWV